MTGVASDFGTGQHRWRWWHAAMLAVIVLVALAPCDIPVARLSYQFAPRRTLIDGLKVIQNVAGNGLGVIIVLTAVVLFSRTKLSRVPLLASIALGGGLLADIVKLCVDRSRPRATDLAVATFTSTFHGLFPFFSVHSGEQSFPSGHSATAIGLAVALTLIYPRGRWFFGLLALAVASIRVIFHAHFPTDVAAGLMLGGTWAFICYRGFAAPAFAWCERTIDSKLAQRSERRHANAEVHSTPAEPAPNGEIASNKNPETRNAA